MTAQRFVDGLNEVRPILDLVRVGSLNRAAMKGIGLDPAVLEPSVAGAVVLVVSRFERFLKEIANASLAQYGLAKPPVKRSQLDPKLQAKILSMNIAAANQKTKFGTSRSDVDRVSSIDSVANRIVADEVWGDDAIETHSNPNSDTVRSILALLGVSDPWKEIEAEFAPLWSAQQGKRRLKNVPNAQAELESIMTWRNIAAHTGGGLPIGPQELDETVEFFECLGLAVDEVLVRATHTTIRGRGSMPGKWP